MVAVLAEKDDRSVVSSLCTRYRWEVFFANTIEEARPWLEEIRPQILLMDRDAAGSDWRKAMFSLASVSNGACIHARFESHRRLPLKRSGLQWRIRSLAQADSRRRNLQGRQAGLVLLEQRGENFSS
jgi:hypothetical protein